MKVIGLATSRGGTTMTLDERDGPDEAVDVIDTLTTAAGVSASIVRSGAGGELVRITDAAGQVLFQLDTRTRATVILAPDGDVELRAPNGKVRLVAGGGIELDTPGVRGRVGEVSLEGSALHTAFDRVRSTVGVLEVHAGRIVERAKNVYREVEELSQTRAGRLRLVAAAAVSILGQRAVVKAKDDVKIKGDKVYLA